MLRRGVLSTAIVVLVVVLAIYFDRRGRLKEGKVIHGWQLMRVQSKAFQISGTTAYLFKHLATNASYLHVDVPNESNNFFSLSFPTTPPNSDNGLVHILEHLCLCGSEKYPVKDPFFSMIKRSLQTYMNAYTASDHTTYLYSTQYEKDYFNLMSVYIDAAFNPMLRELDFMQEAHHFAFANENRTKLEYRGIVYNEMKGAMADPATYFLVELNKLLFHNLTGNNRSPYGYNNGGDPKVIPELTYEEVRKYHARHYSPSKSFIYTYGNIDIQKQLKAIDEQIPRSWPEQNHEPYTVSEVTFANSHLVYGPVDAASTNTSQEVKFGVAWKLGNVIRNPEEIYALNIFSMLLIHKPRGPMYKALIESNLAPDFVPGTGFEASDPIRNETAFIIAVTGISQEAIQLIETTINETLIKVAEEGFDPSHVSAVLNGVELDQKRVSPFFGMTAGYTLIPQYFHGGDVFNVIQRDKILQKFKERVREQNFFQNIVRKYFLENHRRVSLTMLPDDSFTEKQSEDELNTLSDIESTLSIESRETIQTKADTLADYQQNQALSSKELIDVLPTVAVDDIPKRSLVSIDDVLVEQLPQFAGNNSIVFNRQPVGDLVYATIFSGVELAQIPEDLLSYLPILSDILHQLGAGSYDRLTLSQQIDQHTGGISGSVELIPTIIPSEGSAIFKLGISLSSIAAIEKVSQLFELLEVVLLGPHWNETNYLSTLLEQLHVKESESILFSGNAFAELKSSQHLSDFHALSERFNGLTQTAFLEGLLGRNIEEIVGKLKSLSAIVINPKTISVYVTCEEHRVPDMKEQITQLISNLYSKKQMVSQDEVIPFVYQPVTNQSNIFVHKPFPINFVARCYKTVPFLHNDHPALRVLGALMAPELHKEIREKGGAYGSKSSLDTTGILRLSTYRDPNTIKSVNAFASVIAWACNRTEIAITDQQVREAKLKVFQSVDLPTDPHLRMKQWFIYLLNHRVVTDQIRDEYRQNLLAVKNDDIIRVCRGYLENERMSVVAIIGNNKTSNSSLGFTH